MAIPADYSLGFFAAQEDISMNSVETAYVANGDRMFVVNIPASFATGSAVVRNAYLTTSTSDVYYRDSDLGKIDAPLEAPKQLGFDVEEGGELVVYSEELYGTYRSYGFFDNRAAIFRRDVGTVRIYTGISGYIESPGTSGEGTVATENKIYLNNEGAPFPIGGTGSWNNILHDQNAANSTLDETSSYTIKKRGCNSLTEYIVDGVPYAPEGLVRTFVTPPDNLPAKVVSAGQSSGFYAGLWICSKKLNKISLIVSRDFTDSEGILRVKGEVLIENSIGNKNNYSPVAISEDVPYTSSDGIVFKTLDWICFYIGCTDGYIRFVCWNATVPSTSIIKDDRGCLWVAYEAQKN